MNRYEKIMNHPSFEKYLNKIDKIEKERIYCRHGISHLLDVARIAWILNLEDGQPFSKDIIYGAALLHDIGKVKQYKKGIPHEVTGAEKAIKILEECDYKEEEIILIQRAILDHRHGPVSQKKYEYSDIEHQHRLSTILYEADKKSRVCRYCKAKDSCNWPKERKNLRLIY